jgi:hypothetical protein
LFGTAFTQSHDKRKCGVAPLKSNIFFPKRRRGLPVDQLK